MMKKNLIVATLLAVSHAGHAGSARTTGNDLMQHCLTAPDSFCAGYIGGVVDTSHALFCFPPDVTKRQIINNTIMFLRDNPKKLHLFAPSLVIMATRSGFPCNDG